MSRCPRTAQILLLAAAGLSCAIGAAYGDAGAAAGAASGDAGAATQGSGADSGASVQGPAGGGSAPTTPEGGLELTELQRTTLPMELSTAGFYELAAMARELGLQDSGTADEIRARLYERYGIPPPPAPSAGRTITIERAAKAGFAKVEEEEGGIVRASGGVIITLKETNGDVHRIKADSVVYNRARSTITARGSVRYERRSGSSVEAFTGEALSASLDDWSGVFLDGKVRTSTSGSSGTAGTAASGTASGTSAAGSGSSGAGAASSASTTGSSSGGGSSAAAQGERGLVVQADTILKRSSDVMVLQNGVITACDEDDPHYAIRAKRVWILGDKEWAMSNAVFSLGNVPILWVPFFYYPGDEIVFHPVIGYRSREGRFLQTTTYLLGAKPPKTSATTVVSYKDDGTSKPTELKGIFLRRVSGPPPEDKGTLKVMADYYSGLGAFSGLSGSFPKLGDFGKTSLLLGVGRSRSLFETSSSFYSPYVSDGGYESVWNSSDFLGVSMPIRYALDLSTTYSSGGLTTTVALPLYSDPYFEQDFMDRSEDMDWFKLFHSSTSDTDTSDISTRSQLIPTINTTYSLKPDLFGPYLSSIEVTRLTTTAILDSKSSTADSLKENSTLFDSDPNRTFFYPDTFRPYDASVTFKGTLYSSGQLSPPAGQKPKPDGADSGGSSQGRQARQAATDELRDPWMDSAPGSGAVGAAGATGSAGGGGGVISPAASDLFRLPARAPDLKVAKDDDWAESLGWSFTPSTYYENSYLSDDLEGPRDVNYQRLYSLSSYKMVATLDGSASYGDWLSSSLSYAFTDQGQERPYLNAEDQDATDAYHLADKTYTSRSLVQTSKLTVRPFASDWLWSGTNVGWNMIATVYSYDYDTGSSSFDREWLSWTPDMITTNDLSTVLAAQPWGLTQSLSLTAALPPVLESYAGKLSLDGGIGTFYTQTRMYRAIKGADFSWGATLGVAPWPVLSDTYIYSIEESQPQSNIAGLAWGPASFSLTSSQTQSYKPVAGVGWVAYGDEEFRFSSYTIGLNPQIKGDDSAKGGPAWSLGLTLGLDQSLVRFTDSSLSIGLNATYRVNSTLSLTLASLSINSEAWRYFPGAFKKDLDAIGANPEDYQVNPLTDLWDSLSIWDREAQERSLIKLKSLSLKAAQDLHDWTLSAEISTKPLYNATDRTYSLDTTFSILLSWKDIPDISTTITKETGEPVSY